MSIVEHFRFGMGLTEGDEASVETDEVFAEADDTFKRLRRSAPVQYPTGKANHFSKDRRYIPCPKKSDCSKIHSSQGKGAKHRKNEKRLNS